MASTLQPQTHATRAQATLQRALRSQEATVLLGLIAIGLFFAFATPFFLTPFNLFQIVRQMAVLTIIAIGMTFVIGSGEIDISVGSMYNLAATAMALTIVRADVSPWPAIFVALAVGFF